MKKKFASIAAVLLISSALTTNTYAATYTVKKGDSLSVIAKKYNISVKELKALNKLKSDRISVKQKLTVPNAKKAFKAASSTTQTYKVKSGDSLEKIAKKYKVSIANLITWNKLKSDKIVVGQKLVIKKPSSTKKNVAKEAANKTTTYIVKSGDTLGKIASNYKVTIDQLKSWNKLKSDNIVVGQKLIVSKPTTSQKAKKPAAPQIKSYDYTVVSGDTLSGIASKAKMTVEEIKKLNNLKNDNIFVGQVLKLTSKVDGGQQPTTKPPVTEKVDYPVDKLIEIAHSYKGVPYLWAGATPGGFDCSGYIYYVYNEAGKIISRTSTEGYFEMSYLVDKPQVGDLVFFKDTYKEGISHMGIYLGNDEFIHASTTVGVTVSSLKSNYYQTHFDSFKRFY